jgi:PAS domain-containing protein
VWCGGKKVHVAHLEMSLTEPFAAPLTDVSEALAVGTVDHWSDAVDGATEPCLVIDAKAVVTAASPAACTLFGFPGPRAALGLCLHDDVLPLIDFGASASPLPETDLAKIPPVQALLSERLSRGLLRVRLGADIVTIDAIATPLWEDGAVAGSLTFFCTV